MATGMGLHTAESYQTLAIDVTEQQKRLFFSLYMMDRYDTSLGYQSLATDSTADNLKGRVFGLGSTIRHPGRRYYRRGLSESLNR